MINPLLAIINGLNKDLAHMFPTPPPAPTFHQFDLTSRHTGKTVTTIKSRLSQRQLEAHYSTFIVTPRPDPPPTPHLADDE